MHYLTIEELTDAPTSVHKTLGSIAGPYVIKLLIVVCSYPVSVNTLLI